MLSTIETLGTWQAVASAPACTPASPNSCLAEPGAEENSIPGLVKLYEESFPQPIACPTKFWMLTQAGGGDGHPRCWGEALKPHVSAEGEHDLLCSDAFS